MKLLSALLTRHVGVYLVVVMTFAFGVLALRSLPVSYYPKFTAPALVIQTVYRNAGAEEVEDSVTSVLEDALASLSDVERMVSTTRDGLSTVTLSFDWGVDFDSVKLEVLDRVNKTRPLLPRETSTPQVRDIQSFLPPAIELVLTGAELGTLRDMAERYLEDPLAQLPQMGSVRLSGGASKAVVVTVDMAALSNAGLSLDSLVQQLSAEVADLPAGIMEVPGSGRLNLRIKGSLRSLRSLEELVISKQNRVVKLSDVAQVRVDRKPTDTIARLDGKEVVLIQAYEKSDGNTTALAHAVKQALPDLRRRLPSGIELAIADDQSVFIETALFNVALAGILGALLAALILGLFTGSLRDTVIVAISIPLSTMGTIVLMRGFGLSLNTISLGGLALGVGMIVDASVVVVENVLRHVVGLRDPGELTERMAGAVSEVIAPLVASVLTSIVVFLPLAFLEGLFSILLGEMALTIVFALVLSIVVALFAAPVMQRRGLYRRLSRGTETLETEPRFVAGLRRAYGGLLRRVLHRRAVFLCVSVPVLLATCSVGQLLDQEQLPRPNTREFFVELSLPRGTQLGQTEAVLTRIEDIIRASAEVSRLRTRVGSLGALGEELPETGEIRVELEPSALADATELTRAMETVRQQARALVPTATVKVVQRDPSQGMKRADIDLVIFGDDLDQLAATAEQARAIIAQHEAARDVTTTLRARTPELDIEIDRAALAHYGARLSSLSLAASAATRGVTVNFASIDGRRLDLDLRLLQRPHTATELRQLELPIAPIPGGPATSVQLGQLATISPGEGPAQIQHFGRLRAVEVVGDIATGAQKRAVRAQLERAIGEKLVLPPGYQVEWVGAARSITRSLVTMAQALVIGLFLVFAVMAAQFNSLRKPLIILLSVPPAVGGALLALYLGGQTINLNSTVGILMLLGIAVNNGILLVDFIDTKLAEGLPLNDALVEGSSLRLRPILVTSLTTLAGMLPLALGLGEGSEPVQSLGLAVFGGLFFSTFLTLFAVPVVYSFFSKTAPT